MRVKFTDDGCKGLFSTDRTRINRARLESGLLRASRGSGGLSLRKTPSTLTGTRLLALTARGSVALLYVVTLLMRRACLWTRDRF